MVLSTPIVTSYSCNHTCIHVSTLVACTCTCICVLACLLHVHVCAVHRYLRCSSTYTIIHLKQIEKMNHKVNKDTCCICMGRNTSISSSSVPLGLAGWLAAVLHGNQLLMKGRAATVTGTDTSSLLPLLWCWLPVGWQVSHTQCSSPPTLQSPSHRTRTRTRTRARARARGTAHRALPPHWTCHMHNASLIHCSSPTHHTHPHTHTVVQCSAGTSRVHPPIHLQ